VAAQWETQSLTIKPGWTAVYVFVDASYTNLDYLVGSDATNPIDQIWMWEPTVSPVQYVTSIQNPVTGNSQWANWARLSTGLSRNLAALAPNAAYLVHSTAAGNYTWNIVGKAAAPNYAWSSSSINLVGFRTVSPQSPLLDQFLTLAPGLSNSATFYQYGGGDLSSNNPAQVNFYHTVAVNPGQAFWLSAPGFVNSYYGPFSVDVSPGATAFGASASSTSFRLSNQSVSNLTVSLSLVGSQVAPAGQTPIAGLVPVVVRGAQNSTNLTYRATDLATAGSLSWTLAPAGQAGSVVTVVFGVNRAVLTNNPGAYYAGILRFNDSYGLSQVDVPVSAVAGSYAGLWVGQAAVSQVSAYLKSYQTDGSGAPVQGANGAYVVTGVNTNLGGTASAYPITLIVHNDGANANLMQRVFYGQDVNSNTVVATAESVLDPAQLGTARRISAIQFPWTTNNQTWPFTGQLAPGASLTTLASVAYDDQINNPFLHTYHPDHDNLDATKQNQLPLGSESFQLDRQITLNIAGPGNDYNSLTQYGQSLSGSYGEAITVRGAAGAARTFNVAGAFTLNRLSPISTLTRPR